MKNKNFRSNTRERKSMERGNKNPWKCIMTYDRNTGNKMGNVQGGSNMTGTDFFL